MGQAAGELVTWVSCGRNGWWLGWVGPDVVAGTHRCKIGQRLLRFCGGVCSLAGNAENNDFDRAWANVLGGHVIAVDWVTFVANLQAFHMIGAQVVSRSLQSALMPVVNTFELLLLYPCFGFPPTQRLFDHALP